MGHKVTLCTEEFVADMGFAGMVRTPVGFVVGEREQIDKNGRRITVLETILDSEREKLRMAIDDHIDF